MRRRVRRVALTAVVVAVLLLAVPFAIGIRISFFSDESTELERAALAAAIQVGPDFTSGDPVELPASPTDGQLAVYDTSARLRAGAGPTEIDEVTRTALTGKVSEGRIAGDLVVAVPVVASEQVIGVVRSTSPVNAIWSRVLLAWLGVAALAAVALLVGAVVAARQAGRLTRPLESLAGVARSVTAGDLTARTTASGIAEIDDASAAQNTMVTRLSTVLDHARHFGTDASHQLRNPLAGLRLGLETALHDPCGDPRTALKEALDRTDELQSTVEQVLALSRLSTEPAGTLGTVGELAMASRQLWHGALGLQGRRLDFRIPAAVAALAIPRNVCLQILDILIDNASKHGRGAVLVIVREAFDDALAIEVADEGRIESGGSDVFRRGVTGLAGSGVGLGLARDLAEAQGGRLSLASSDPTVFSLLLPARNHQDHVHAVPHRKDEHDGARTVGERSTGVASVGLRCADGVRAGEF